MAPSSLARSDIDPKFVKPIILALSDIALPVTDPASVSIETAQHIAPSSYNCSAAHTSCLLAPQIASAQLHPDLEIRYFLVPAPAGSDSIAHLANITGATIYSSPDIDTFVKGCQFQTIAAPPPSAYHLATPLTQSLATSGFLSDIALPVTDPASVSIETAQHIAPSSYNCSAAHTSCLLAPQIASAQLHPDLEIRYFLVPAPAGSDSIAHLANITGATIYSSPDIDTFVKGCQFQTIAAPPPSAYHLATPLTQSLATSGFLAPVSNPWSLDAIKAAISKGSHTSTQNPASTAFCRVELAYRVSHGFSLLLTLEVAVLLFGRNLRISRLVSVPQTNWKDWLICDSIVSPPGGILLLTPLSDDTPAANMSTNRTVAPQSMQFGSCLSRILQHI